MAYARLRPSPRLESLVSDIWIQESLTDARRASFPPTRALPTGFVDIAFYYLDPFLEIRGSERRLLPRVTVTGPQTTYNTYVATGRTGIVMARLRPGTASRILRLPLHQIRDLNVDLADLLPTGRVDEISTRLQEATKDDARVALVELFLASELVPDRGPTDVTAAVDGIVRSGGRLSVSDLARSLALSVRQLQRLFREHVGIGPKGLSRITRLQRAIDLRVGGMSWARAAHTAGYQDQSHLANDCRAIAGLSPDQVLSRRQATPLATFYNGGQGASALCHTLYL